MSGGKNMTKKRKTTHANSSASVISAHRDMSKVNIVITVLTVLADLGVVYTMLNTTRFASLSKPTFILVNILMMILLVALNVVVMMGIRSRKKTMYTIIAKNSTTNTIETRRISLLIILPLLIFFRSLFTFLRSLLKLIS